MIPHIKIAAGQRRFLIYTVRFHFSGTLRINFGIAKSIGKCIDRLIILAQSTAFGTKGLVIRYVRRTEQGIDRNPHHRVWPPENREEA